MRGRRARSIKMNQIENGRKKQSTQRTNCTNCNTEFNSPKTYNAFIIMKI